MLDQKKFQVYAEEEQNSSAASPNIHDRMNDSSIQLNPVQRFSFNDFFSYEPKFFKKKIFKIDRKNDEEKKMEISGSISELVDEEKVYY